MSEELRESFAKFSEAMWVINDYVEKILQEDETLSRYSKQQIETLRIIHKNPNISQKEISSIQGVFKTAISNRIRKLEQDGLIVINSDKDMRRKSVSLTSDGLKIVKLAEEMIFENLNSLLEDDFSKGEVIHFTEQLEKIVTLLKSK